MSDPSQPQNLNQTSPSALNTGAPPAAELPLTPVPETPSTAAGAPAPPTTSDGTTVSPTTTTANSGPSPTDLGRASSGAPAQPAGAGLDQGGNTFVFVSGGGSGGGATAFRVVRKTTTYAAALNDFVLADPSTASFDVTLPTVPSATANAIIVKNISPGTNPVTVRALGGATIDGVTSVDLFTGEYLYIIFDGVSEWFAISENLPASGISFERVISQPADGDTFVVNMPVPQKD